jgi:hypothetical protein
MQSPEAGGNSDTELDRALRADQMPGFWLCWSLVLSV